MSVTLLAPRSLAQLAGFAAEHGIAKRETALEILCRANVQAVLRRYPDLKSTRQATAEFLGRSDGIKGYVKECTQWRDDAPAEYQEILEALSWIEYFCGDVQGDSRVVRLLQAIKRHLGQLPDTLN